MPKLSKPSLEETIERLIEGIDDLKKSIDDLPNLQAEIEQLAKAVDYLGNQIYQSNHQGTNNAKGHRAAGR